MSSSSSSSSSSASAYDPMAFDPFAHNFYIIDIETELQKTLFEKLERLNEKEFGHLTPDQVNWYMEFGKELEDSIKNEAAAKEAFRKKEEASARRALLLSSGGSSLAQLLAGVSPTWTKTGNHYRVTSKPANGQER